MMPNSMSAITGVECGCCGEEHDVEDSIFLNDDSVICIFCDSIYEVTIYGWG
jgi:hypothetical protein